MVILLLQGYHYEETTIVEDDKFIGLALDETNKLAYTKKNWAWLNDIKKSLNNKENYV